MLTYFNNCCYEFGFKRGILFNSKKCVPCFWFQKVVIRLHCVQSEGRCVFIDDWCELD